MIYDQAEFTIRCEWGLQGLLQLAPVSDAVVIVDVLSFSTAVDVAASRGATVYPFAGPSEAAAAFASSVGAELAGKHRDARQYSLSPGSLATIPRGTALVLPSPNGSRLSLAAGSTPTLTACLRNYPAVAASAQQHGSRIAVIPAGERWPDGSLRPALEDWLGAGAVISCLKGELSPEARAARAIFLAAEPGVAAMIAQCSSGKELIARGFGGDVELASALRSSECSPLLVDGAYRNANE